MLGDDNIHHVRRSDQWYITQVPQEMKHTAKGNSNSYKAITSKSFHKKVFSKTLRKANLQFGNQLKPDWDKSMPSASPPIEPASFLLVGIRTRTLSYHFLPTMVQKGDMRAQSYNFSTCTKGSRVNGSSMHLVLETSGPWYLISQWDGTFYNLLHFLFEYR